MGRCPATGGPVWDTGDHAPRMMLRRQTDLTVQAFRGQARIALIRPILPAGTGIGHFDRTVDFYQLAPASAPALLELLPDRSLPALPIGNV